MRTRKRALEESTADKNIKRQFDEHKESDATTTSSSAVSVHSPLVDIRAQTGHEQLLRRQSSRRLCEIPLSYSRDPLNLNSIRPQNDQNDTSAPSETTFNLNSSDRVSENESNTETSNKRRRKRMRRPRNSMIDDIQGSNNSTIESIIVTPAIVQRRYSCGSRKKRSEVSTDSLAVEGCSNILDEDDSNSNQMEQSSGTSQIADSDIKTQPDAKSGRESDRIERRKMLAYRYRYGNFNFYYQKKRCASQLAMSSNSFSPMDNSDPRVELFVFGWFSDKAVLDIGCNSGFFTISLYNRYHPSKIVGMDIDSHLINTARKNLRYSIDRESKTSSKFPTSFAVNYGPISVPSEHPENISFLCENYVLPSDNDLQYVQEEYDIIIALATVKWVHLNWGDAGLKRFFARAFRQLKAGGRFILEYESFNVYRKHCNRKGSKQSPDEVINTFKSIQLFPENFANYLLDVVGFTHVEEMMDTPLSKSCGISGHLQVFYKGKFMIESEGDSNTYPTLALASTSQRIEDEDDVLQQQQQLMSTPPTSSVALSPYESQVINGLTTPEQNSGPENEWDN